MHKTIKITIFTLLCITTAGISIAWWKFSKELQSAKPCAFCNTQILKTHTFYEDALVRGLCNHKPVQPGHCLAVIKRHIESFDESTPEEISAIGRLLKKINTATQKIRGPSAYMILQKNGHEVGQTVPHVHFHYIPKRKSKYKSIPLFGLLWSFIKTVFKKPIRKEELEKSVTLMKEEFAKIKENIMPTQTTRAYGKITENLFHKDSPKRAIATMQLMQIGKKETLPKSIFETWKRAALDESLSYEHTGTADCCKLTEIKVMGNHNGKEATYAISSAGAQSIPVRRDVLDEEYFVISGNGAVWIKTNDNEQVISVQQGSHVIIPKGANTQFKNFGDDKFIFLVITSPPYEQLVAKNVKIETRLDSGYWD